MSRRLFQRDPGYRLHRQSGQAIVTLVNDLGVRRDYLLGIYGTPESRAEYRRLLAEWEAGGHVLPRKSTDPATVPDLTVDELILAFWRHAETHYRHPDGRPTSELDLYRLSLRALRELYGHTTAKSFGPLALKAVRQKMVASVNPKTGLRWCRKNINQRVERIKRLFKWAVSEELVPAATLMGLQSVKGLLKGRTDARESEPVRPVPDAHVEAALAFMRPQVAAMVQLQRYTGMRPGEVCTMRGVDLDTSGPVWLYKPTAHKTAWRGKERIIPVGPQAQAVLKSWLRLRVDEFLFQPREAMAAFHAARRQARKTPIQPSQRARRPKKNPKRQPGECYTPASYGRVIETACELANVPEWNPNQLRNTRGTEVRRRYGLEGAQVTLGHSSAQVTQVYAERDQALAEKIAAEIG